LVPVTGSTAWNLGKPRVVRVTLLCYLHTFFHPKSMNMSMIEYAKVSIVALFFGGTQIYSPKVRNVFL